MISMTVLDHGYVKYVTHCGSDESIIEAARMSTNKSFKGWPEDEKLLRYLWSHKHTSPFEMGDITIEVQAPIFVFREWHRHRTQSFNEMSARYTPLPDVNYLPNLNRIMIKGGKNKQASSQVEGLTVEAGEVFQSKVWALYKEIQKLYEVSLSNGIPKELARIILPVGRYSRMRAKSNLLNWLRFLRLRLDENAQLEIRQYALAVDSIVELLFPRTHRIFHEGAGI